MSSSYIRDRVVLVTGASKGIGKSILFEFAKTGAKLAFTSRSESLLSAISTQLIEMGVESAFESFDLIEPGKLESFIKTVETKLGPIQILINNAGVYETAPLINQTLETWRAILEVNLTAAMRASQAVLPGMIQNNWGRIINISSISGKCGEAYGSAYSASKFALIGMTQSLALEVASDGITVNSICPGWVATDMAYDQLQDQAWCQLNQIAVKESIEIARLSVPQQRLIEPSEVASLATYLCSEGARGITGQAINICGGLSLH